MTDTLGEDRLLDLGDIERALHAATPGPWILNPERDSVVHIPDGLGGFGEAHGFREKANARLVMNAPDWLARLCARVRHLEAERDELLKARSIWDTSITAAWKAEQETRAASQRLTEALRQMSGVSCSFGGAAGMSCDALGLVTKCPSCTARTVLGAGAPPEGRADP